MSKLRIVFVFILVLGVPMSAVGPVGRPMPHEKAAAAPPSEARPKDAEIGGDDPLPAGVSARFGSIRLRHGDHVNAVAFSPDGKVLAACSGGRNGFDNTVRFWDPRSGKLLRRLVVPSSGVGAMMFAPDGEALATGNREGRFTLWDATTAKEIIHMETLGHSEYMSLAFSPDGKRLATGKNWEAVIWELPSGKELRKFEKLEREVQVAFAEDGRTLVTGDGSGKLRFWDAASGKLTRDCDVPKDEGDRAQITGLAVSPDGKMVIAGQCCSTHVWDVTTGKILLRLPGHESDYGWRPDTSFVFAADGKTFFSGGSDGWVRRWDAATGRELARYKGCGYSYHAVAVSPDGKTVAAGGQDHLIHLWDVRTGRPVVEIAGHRQPVRTLDLAPDGKILATAGEDGTVRLWDAATGRELHRFHRERRALAFSPDGRILAAAARGGTLNLWDVQTHAEQLAVLLDANEVACMAYARDGSVLAVGDDGGVLLVDSATGETVRRLRGHKGQVHGLAYSPDGRSLISCGKDATVRCWNFTTGAERWSCSIGQAEAISVAFSPDGRRAAIGAADGQIFLRDAATGKAIRAIHSDRNNVCALCFAPSGKTLAAATGPKWGHSLLMPYGGMRLWDVDTGDKLHEFEGHLESVSALAFSPDGKVLYSSSVDGTVLRWDLPRSLADRTAARGKARPAPVLSDSKNPRPARGDRPRILHEHGVDITALAFSPDGKKLASMSKDGQLLVSAVATRKRIFAIPGHRSGEYALAWSPDGKQLACADKDGVIRLRDAADGKQLAALRGHKGIVPALVYSPDGNLLASGGYDGRVYLWDVQERKERRHWKGNEGRVTSLSFTPDGKTLATAGVVGREVGGANIIPMTHADKVRLWDVETAKEMTAPALRGETVAFSTDGRSLCAAGLLPDIRRTDKGVSINGQNRITVVRHGIEVLQISKRGTAAVVSPDNQLLVTGPGTDRFLIGLGGGNIIGGGDDDPVPTLHWWELATGKEVLALPKVNAALLAFAPDGRTLAYPSGDDAVVLLDVVRAAAEEANDPKALWEQLADEDAAIAFRASCSLILGGSEVVALLRERVRPISAAEAERVKKLLAQLGDERFEEREAASRSLRRLGAAIEPVVREAANGRPALEVRRRLETILKEIEKKRLGAEELRCLRSIRVLEQIGTPEARRILKDLSRGANGFIRTDESGAALRRLDKRGATSRSD